MYNMYIYDHWRDVRQHAVGDLDLLLPLPEEDGGPSYAQSPY